MFYKKINLLDNHNDNDVIYGTVSVAAEKINETYPDIFLASSSTGDKLATLSIYDKSTEKLLFEITTEIKTDVSANRFNIKIKREIGDIDLIQSTPMNDDSSSSSYGSTYATVNYLTELIIINRTTFALTLDAANSITYPGMKKPGILVITKTVKGNFALIQPSYIMGIGRNNDANPNCLSCLTCKSTGDTKYFSNIFFESALTYQTVLSPVMVNGDADYCESVFWIPMIQFEINRNDDAILEIAGEYYYYNGFIACKIGK